ncbi:hypothetical protein [Gluconobacter kanchanaburiensis]|uniref:Uncharacterized protein n=1 Tax=Gluconobacter kanchanaburiensis NBRC 103587 TaxID=1307948 RepID=A0A511BB71_9PROT|nr:hypothetical protein [Gluconobacter kanchanaburiensis]MBF0860755.1 hypothetical protein [Gluconobacter kanchanaburiensis]GBR69729.1 hypothetical protein AA103587_1490 [Gluconobacter kanchanaburiensis NBRC 103587]GEK95067.1 hypothetical protein GKA01_02640 [Gluconobacter kanchanaburiensis NBRC 103587]
MTTYFLAFITFVIWAALYSLYFREPIRAWFVNRFEKDTPLPQTDDDTVEPLNYAPPSKETQKHN